MKKLLLILPFTFLITACGEPSVEDLVEDKGLLAQTIKECLVEAVKGEKSNSKKCANANEAQKQLSSNLYNDVVNKFK
ncbi:EexN family lipoprotein [Candidatus Thioglobus sp.]|uniref:EexN family lipoprotein n=1 Tax=Candidatus Thioglobus sp. TaxID=2026721 RepID=UPI003D0D1957